MMYIFLSLAVIALVASYATEYLEKKRSKNTITIKNSEDCTIVQKNKYGGKVKLIGNNLFVGKSLIDIPDKVRKESSSLEVNYNDNVLIVNGYYYDFKTKTFS